MYLFFGISLVSSVWRNVREYWKPGNQKRTIQWNWKHRIHKTTKKQNKKHNTIRVGHHYAQTNTYNVNKTWPLLQITEGKDNRTSVVCENLNGHHKTKLEIVAIKIYLKFEYYATYLWNDFTQVFFLLFFRLPTTQL